MQGINKKIVIATIAIAFGFLGFLSRASAQTNCSNANNVSVISSTNISMTPAYQPFGGSALVSTFDVTVQNNNNKTCSILLAFVRTTAPTQMGSGPFSLNYTLDFNGNSVVNYGSPTSGWYTDVPANSPFTFSTYNLIAPANQTSSAAGAYSDSQVAIYLYAYKNGWRFVRTYSLNLSATINKTCMMLTPSPSTLNFSSAISVGVPNPGAVMTTTLSNVNCTSPAKITLNGSAMQRTPAIGIVSGFDSFINWQATAVFGGAIATLDTSFGSTTTSANYNVGSGTTAGGVVGVDVNLLAGQRLRSGNYTGVLTVTISPTP